MRFALVNPAWSFEGSIYFGCREPHLPLELNYSKALLEASWPRGRDRRRATRGAYVQADLRRVQSFAPDFTVITTAPSYLFWRCAPPEIRIPMELSQLLRPVAGRIVVVGPHGSTTPRPVLRKLGADYVVLGECEEVLPFLAGDPASIPSVAFRQGEEIIVRGPNRASDMKKLPSLRWPDAVRRRHHHHHHRFDAEPTGPGAEMEASRGCPYHCTFCAKDNFRNNYRKRPVPVVLEELDALIRQGIEYVYFIDEIFLPDMQLLTGLRRERSRSAFRLGLISGAKMRFGALAKAGCVSIEAGVESITEAGRAYLDKKCKMSTDELSDRLIFAKQLVPFVQANLLAMTEDDTDGVEAWRQRLDSARRMGKQASPAVPLSRFS